LTKGINYLGFYILTPNTTLDQMLVGSAVILVWYLFNLRKVELLFWSVGILTNCFVVFLNRNRMPVTADFYLSADKQQKYVTLDSQTKLPYLGDIIRIPSPEGSMHFISIGDIAIYSAVILFFCKFFYFYYHNRSEE
ncbi:DUF5317 domain-containing protein, partial [Candidatus Parcubacteria bacterium]|nr:DUF5317 domain-containing protein [Candidatus Parcubacteria bacterium]